MTLTTFIPLATTIPSPKAPHSPQPLIHTLITQNHPYYHLHPLILFIALNTITMVHAPPHSLTRLIPQEASIPYPLTSSFPSQPSLPTTPSFPSSTFQHCKRLSCVAHQVWQRPAPSNSPDQLPTTIPTKTILPTRASRTMHVQTILTQKTRVNGGLNEVSPCNTQRDESLFSPSSFCSPFFVPWKLSEVEKMYKTDIMNLSNL